MYMVHNTNPVADKLKSYMYFRIKLIWPWKWPSLLYWSYNFDLDIYNQQTLVKWKPQDFDKNDKKKTLQYIQVQE